MCSTVGHRATTGCVMIAVRHADPLSRRWSAATAGELRLSVARPTDPDNTCVSSRTATAERPRHDPPRSCDGVVRRGGRWPADDGGPSTVAAQQPALAVPRTRRSAARKEPTCWWPALVRPAAEQRPPEVGGDRTRPGGPVRSANRRSAGVLHGNPGGGKCHDAASSRGALRHAAAKSCIGRSSTSLRQAIVPNAGVGSRPVSILRNVSGDMPAACATSPRSRSARASRSSAPRRLPASICSDVSGLRTTPPRVRLVF